MRQAGRHTRQGDPPSERVDRFAGYTDLWYNVTQVDFAERNLISDNETTDQNGMDARYYVAALGRGLRILEAFSDQSPTLSLTEISSAAGLEKSTAFRSVHTLETLGYLVRDPQTKRYRPGLNVLRLGFAALNSMGLRQIAQPYLETLSVESGETTNMTVRDGPEVVYVARYKTTQIVSINLVLGSRLPVYCTSMGKAQLIDLSREQLSNLLGEGPYPELGPNTITSLDDLTRELERVRRQGYAINDEELAAGLRSVAAPLRNADGEIIAAINISVPSARVSRDKLEERLAPLVKTTAHDICLALGANLPS